MRMYPNRTRLNQGGYDRYGFYWGIGQPLYHYFDDGDSKEHVDGDIRADGRDHAKAKILAIHPEAVFAR